jgi:hypothetical protein
MMLFSDDAYNHWIQTAQGANPTIVGYHSGVVKKLQRHE